MSRDKAKDIGAYTKKIIYTLTSAGDTVWLYFCPCRAANIKLADSRQAFILGIFSRDRKYRQTTDEKMEKKLLPAKIFYGL